MIVNFFCNSEASETLTDAGHNVTNLGDGVVKFITEVDDEIIDSLCLDTLCDEVGIPSDCLIHLSF